MAVISVKAEAENSTVTYIDAGGHRVIIDEPPAFGGEDTAPSPGPCFSRRWRAV